MKKQSGKGLKNRLKIVSATITVVFTLASTFTATMAWFSSNQQVTASGMTVQIKTPDGVDYDLYYLQTFGTNVDISNNYDGNYNPVINKYCGYEIARNDPNFVKYNPNLDYTATPNPISIDNLWPNHKMTFALLLTNGEASDFLIKNWQDAEDKPVRHAIKLGGDITYDEEDDSTYDQISLSWAINIFGGAYRVSNLDNEENALANEVVVANGFSSPSLYNKGAGLSDCFTYAQGSEALSLPITVSNTIPSSSPNSSLVFYFTIEFSNNEDTFYVLNDGDYYSKSTSGNSNCYEGLAFSELVFELK